MVKQKVSTIEKVEFVRDGIKNGKAWSMHKVFDGDGDRYTTFQAEPWRSYAGDGKPHQIDFDETKDGKWTNRTIIAPSKPKEVYGGLPPVTNQPTAWDKMFDKMNLIQAEVEKIGKMVAKLSEDKVAEEMPPLDKVPF